VTTEVALLSERHGNDNGQNGREASGNCGSGAEGVRAVTTIITSAVAKQIQLVAIQSPVVLADAVASPRERVLLTKAIEVAGGRACGASHVLGALAGEAAVSVGANTAILARVRGARGLESTSNLAVDSTEASPARAKLGGNVAGDRRNAGSTVQASVASAVAGGQSSLTIDATKATGAVAIKVGRRTHRLASSAVLARGGSTGNRVAVLVTVRGRALAVIIVRLVSGRSTSSAVQAGIGSLALGQREGLGAVDTSVARRAAAVE
jgi:hypothetical protein